jgi:hypothetical protein
MWMLQRWMRLGWFLLVSLGFGAVSAGAAPIPNAVYTLDDPVAFSIIGASGTVDAYYGPIDFNDTICLDGGCGDPNDFSNQDWMIFTVTVESGTLDQVTVGALFASSIGVGYLEGTADPEPTGGNATTNPNSPEWLFASLGGTSAPLIAMYSAGALPTLGGGPFAPGATNFDLRLGGASDQFVGSVTTLVPEPTTALLVGMGLLGLGLSRRSRD